MEQSWQLAVGSWQLAVGSWQVPCVVRRAPFYQQSRQLAVGKK